MWSFSFYSHNKDMTYFNYHAKLKRLISEGHLIKVEYVNEHHGISPAMVFYFDNSRSMPIREYRFREYELLLAKINFKNKTT